MPSAPPAIPFRRPAPPGRSAWVALLLLAGTMGLFEVTPLDLLVQDRFFDFAAGRWLVDRRDPVGRLLFYTGPKALIIAAGVGLLALAAGPARWREKARFRRSGLWVAVLSLASVPLLVGISKQFTNVHGPSEIRRYGGEVPYVAVWSAYPEDDRPPGQGHCFPAGHASGGFALIGLAWLRDSRRWRAGAVALGLGLGWWMGAYQMLKGAHYLSHTVVTMLLAWSVAGAWAALFVRERRTANAPLSVVGPASRTLADSATVTDRR